MTGIEKKLSETARAALTAAKTRPDHLVRPPRLPIAAARQVVRSLLNGGLVEEVHVQIQDDTYVWRTGEDGVAMMLRATALGLARVDAADGAQELPTARETVETGRVALGQLRQEAGAPEAVTVIVAAAQAETETAARPVPAQTAGTSDGALAGPQMPTQANPPGTLRRTAQALLDAWDDATNQESDKIGVLDGLMGALRAALAASAQATSDRSRHPKDTKQAQVLAMLRRQEGASGPAIAEAMGWAPHTVRGFLAGLSKKGVTVEALERVRQVGANKGGARGSYTIYRVAG
jgi:hypothetical protein